MKLKHLLCLAALAFETVAFAQVTISGNVPQSNSTYTLPVTLSAKASSPNTISGWAVYFGNTEYYSSNVGLNGLLDVSLSSAPTGPNQQVMITAFDNAGAHTSYVASNITVVASPLPTPPQSATSYTIYKFKRILAGTPALLTHAPDLQVQAHAQNRKESNYIPTRTTL